MKTLDEIIEEAYRVLARKAFPIISEEDWGV